jgi:hypothetical protein
MSFNSEKEIWENDSIGAPDTISRGLIAKLIGVLIAVALGLALGFGGAIAADAGKNALTWFTLSVGGLIGMLFLTRHREIALIAFFSVAWLTFGATVAQGQSGGGAQTLKISQAGLIVLIAAWVLRRLVRHREEPFFKSPVNVPILIYLLLCVWSTVNSLIFPDAFVLRAGNKTPLEVNLVEVVLRVLALVGMLMVTHSVPKTHLKIAGLALLVPGFCLLVTTEVPKFSRVVPGSGYGVFPQVLAMAVLAALVLSNVGRLWQKIVMAIVAIAIFGVAFFRHSEWVSGWFACGLALLIIAITLQKTNLLVRKLFFGSVAAICLVVFVRFDYFYDKIYKMNFYSGGYMSWGTATIGRTERDIRSVEDFELAREERKSQVGALDNDRVRMLHAATLYAERFPLGIGLGNYKAYNKYYGSPKRWNTTTFTSAHGTYAQTLSETGWLGLIALVWIQISVLVSLWKFHQKMENDWRKAFVLGAFAGVSGMFAATFLGDYILPAYHNGGMSSFSGTIYTWLYAGLAFAVIKSTGLTWNDVSPSRVKTKYVAPAPIWNRPIAKGDQ